MTAASVSDSRADELLKISDSLFQDASGYYGICQEIAENFYPWRADFTSSVTPITAGYASSLMDSTPVLARETLGNYIEAMLRQGEWFKAGTGDEDRDKKPVNATALNRITSIMKTDLNSPLVRFSAAAKQLDMDYVAFGTNCYSWEMSDTLSHLVLKPWHIKDCTWMMDDGDAVEVFFRRFRIKARDYAAKIKSGRWQGTLPPAVRNALDTEPMKKFNMLHVLMPSDMIYGGDGRKMRELKHRLVSTYIDCDNRAYIGERGTKVFNYGVSRWRTVGDFPYGISPAAMSSLPDGRMLQMLALIMLEQGEKAIDPPMIGAGDIFTRDLNFYAGGFTQVDLPEDAKLSDKMTVLQTADRMQVGVEMKADVRAIMAEAWLLNRLVLPNVREMTAYETSERIQEFRRAALPFFSPIDAGYHSPMLDIMLSMKINMGHITPEMLPPEMQGLDARWTFNNPLNEAEGRKVVAAFQETLQITAAAVQIDETVADIVDWRQSATDAVRGAGAKPEWFPTEEEQRKKKETADQKRQLAEAAAIAQRGAGVVADVSNATLAAGNAGIAA